MSFSDPLDGKSDDRDSALLFVFIGDMRPFAFARLPVLLAAQSIAVPSFVVPSFADLTIKTRR
jgi:hypothetical protein